MKKVNSLVFAKQKEYYNAGKTRSVDFRIEQLKKLRKLVKQNENEIMDAIRKDFGKSEFETYITEILQFYNEVNVNIKKLKKWARPKKKWLPITHFPCTGKVYKEPYGVVLIICPFNYPFGLMFTPLISAIAAGNCVMIKPSEYTVHFNEVIEKLVNENFEQNYLYVCDPYRGKDTVNELLELPFQYIFFTGSTRVGKIIMEHAAKNLIPVTLELGGKSPCIITDSANIKMAARRIVWGKFINAGQTCVAPDYIVVAKSVKDKFLEALVNEIKIQYGVNPKENDEYCGIINKNAVERLTGYLEDGTVYYGGDYDKESCYFGPTILTDVGDDSKVMQEEIFGPIIPVVTYDVLEEEIEVLQKKPSPLALYIFTENKEEQRYILEKLPSGDVMINDTVLHVATSKFPFGGVGTSGIGKYHGYSGFETFTHTRSVLYRGTWIEISLRFAPYKNKLAFVRKILK